MKETTDTESASAAMVDTNHFLDETSERTDDSRWRRGGRHLGRVRLDAHIRASHPAR